MREMCSILAPRPDIVSGQEEDGCLRPVGHSGPHICYIPTLGTYIQWETDDECDCEDCQSSDVDDWCVIYGEISAQEALVLIAESDAGTSKQ